MRPAFCKHGYRGNPATCVDCNAGTFAGMETAVTEQAQAAAEYSAEELTARLLEPRKSIDAKTQAIENDSPLFYGVINPTLF
jgi:hypothetical protein